MLHIEISYKYSLEHAQNTNITDNTFCNILPGNNLIQNVLNKT